MLLYAFLPTKRYSICSHSILRTAVKTQYEVEAETKAAVEVKTEAKYCT